ncbi:hypothetical protein F5Y17DRAFT_379366 [Xylariaceae sp. FL0594]|nr:hypothetical protein F5Y17DRAFT_379366 [Xylariaceae sp. FL0594]
MESFAKLKRRGTDLLSSIPQNIASMPQVHMPSMPRIGGQGGLKGTWQHISLPPLPRSSHSLDVVAGNAYLFGGDVEAGESLENDMHVIVLPSSGASTDYFAVKAKPSPRAAADRGNATSTAHTGGSEAVEELQDPLTEVPLTTPASPGAESESEPSSAGKGKGKMTAYSDVPAPRAGHATAVIGTRIFLFGGRSAGEPSSAIAENGRVWVFETKTHTWTYLDPYHSSPIPKPRSDHAAVATDKPRDFSVKPMRLRRTSTWKEWAEGDSAEVGIPQRPIAGTIAEKATDDEAEGAGFGTFIIHGGVLSDGTRTGDVWAFDVHARTWKQLPDAPGPARSGAALALGKSRLYRFGGFGGYEGETPGVIGGHLDVLHLGLDEFDDQNSRGEIGVFARGTWDSLVAPSPGTTTTTTTIDHSLPAAETAGLTSQVQTQNQTTDPWPSPRSGASLSLVQAGSGREYLILLFGESSSSSPSAFHGDVWAFQIPPIGGTAASLTDAFLQSVGRKTGEGRWTLVSPIGPFDDDDDVRSPAPRGWFGAAPLGDLEENGVFFAGGIGPDGKKKLGDGWIFRLA